ncbi:UDP-N-acetylmuramate--L-alanine ligase [soil metagenome]
MRAPFPEQLRAVSDLRRVHLVGIGGAALSGIARLLLAHGTEVSGSDAADSETLDALRSLGARCEVGHAAAHLGDADVLVVSTAVREDNPEVVEARRRGIPVWSRAAAMVSLMAGRRVLAVAGTHGKTTTTSMLVVALLHAGAQPSYAIGSELAATGSNAGLGGGPDFVVEADESDGAFLRYEPSGTVVTNVDADHLDAYGTVEAYRAAFTAYLDRIRAGGFLVVCADDPGADELARQALDRGIETIRVGTGEGMDLQAVDLRSEQGMSTCTVVGGGQVLGPLRLQVPGRHYLIDALAALAVGLRIGLPADALLAGLAGFTSSRRRMEAKGNACGVSVVDSYAHHPVEIAGDVEAARSLAAGSRLVVCFQPHLVSRTKTFGPAMGTALGAADLVVVSDIYLAREDREEGVTGALVADAVPLPAEAVVYAPTLDDALNVLIERVRPGDVVVTLGAGDVTVLGPRLLSVLRAREQADG